MPPTVLTLKAIYERLEQRRQGGDGGFDLLVVEGRDLLEHLVDGTGLLALRPPPEA